MRLSLKYVLIALLLGSLLLTVPMTFAQEEAPEANPAAPGIATLVFLLGAGAIIVVGGVSLARGSYHPEDDTN